MKPAKTFLMFAAYSTLTAFFAVGTISIGNRLGVELGAVTIRK